MPSNPSAQKYPNLYDEVYMNQRCHLTKKKMRSTWMTSIVRDCPNIRRKRKPIGRQIGKAMTADSQYKAQPNAVAVESKERECILGTNSPHVT